MVVDTFILKLILFITIGNKIVCGRYFRLTVEDLQVLQINKNAFQ